MVRRNPYYIPPINQNIALSEANFVLAHDAATGYFDASSIKGADNAASHLYAKNQIGSVYKQLDDGARALDIRPKLVMRQKQNEQMDDDGSSSQSSQDFDVVCHHGIVAVSVSLQQIIEDAVQWCRDNPDELVLILHHNLAWPESITPDADTAVAAVSEVYNSVRGGVAYLDCSDVYGLTVGEVMMMAALSDGVGYLLAIDQHDAYLTSCAKQNYVEDLLVTCYMQNTPACTTIPPPPPSSSWTPSDITIAQLYPSLAALQDYVSQSVNNDPTNDSNTLGPPANDYTYLPFNEIQAVWQVNGFSASLGVAHLSSLLDDNTKSHLNAYIVQWFYSDGLFKTPISLVAIDQVSLNGNALLSVLRTQCGQFEGEDMTCGTALPPPRIQIHHPMSTTTFSATVIACFVLTVWLWLEYRQYRRHFDHEHHLKQLEEDVNQSYITMVDATTAVTAAWLECDPMPSRSDDLDGDGDRRQGSYHNTTDNASRRQTTRIEDGVLT
jgi:hypothetical protein